MTPRGRGGPSRFTLLVLVLASLTLVTLDARDFGPVERMKDLGADVLSPLRRGADAVFGPVGDGWNAAFGSDDLRDETDALRARVEELEGMLIDNEEKARRYDALVAELDIDYLGDVDRVVARVVARGVGNFDAGVIELDRGSSHGLRNGQPVVTAGGLVGRIEDVGRNRARVRLITDPEFAVGIRLVANDEIAVLRGAGDDEPLRVDGGIALEAEVRVGMAVVTSGIERSPYPAGIPVGRIVSVDVDEAILEQRLLIEPSANLARLDHVTVLLYASDYGDDESAPAASASPADTSSGD